MSNLLSTKHVQRIAFGYSSQVTVLECDTLEVFGVQDSESWVFADGSRAFNVEGIYLSYQISFRFVKRASGSEDLIEIINALNDPSVDVDFYPIYDIDAAESVSVIPAMDEIRVGNIERFRNIPSYDFRIEEKNRRSGYPSWLHNTRSV